MGQDTPWTPTKGPLELPSFISLSSSPEEADAPETQLADSSQGKGKDTQPNETWAEPLPAPPPTAHMQACWVKASWYLKSFPVSCESGSFTVY